MDDFQHIGLLAAMPEELGCILDNLENIKEANSGDLTIYSGIWKNKKQKKFIISTAWSGWGKVSAARATAKLCGFNYLDKKIDFILFTGVAGGVDLKTNIWDIVVADSVVQHDIDARPLYKEFFIPALNKDKIKPVNFLKEKLIGSLQKAKNDGLLNKFGSIHEGLIATGDSFITDLEFIKKLKQKLKGLLAIEMEGASFAQVAEQENIPWILFRVISDNANEVADHNFSSFIKEYKKFSWELVNIFLNDL